jgi:8-oxo-dGTP diphosphatase
MDTSKAFGLSVRAVIHDADGRILLLKRSMLSKNYPGKWEFPGGKVDRGERFDAALVREVREETGLVVTLGAFIGAAKAEMPRVTAVQLVMEAVPGPGSPAISAEHEGLTWARPQEILDMDMVDWVKPFVRAHLVK